MLETFRFEDQDDYGDGIFSLYVSRKLPTYPSPKSTFCPKWEISFNVGFGEG